MFIVDQGSIGNPTQMRPKFHMFISTQWGITLITFNAPVFIIDQGGIDNTTQKRYFMSLNLQWAVL